jgi:hypothetical protein
LKKKKNILTLVFSEKKILNETKNHNPPSFKLNGRSLITIVFRKSKEILLVFSQKVQNISILQKVINRIPIVT